MTDKQIAVTAIAEMVAQSKALIDSAVEMANENNIYFSYESFYEDISGNDNVDWNSSFC